MRKGVLLFLAFAMLFALSLPVFAAESEAQEAAQTLYDLGLFKGTGADASGNPVFDADAGRGGHDACAPARKRGRGACGQLEHALHRRRRLGKALHCPPCFKASQKPNPQSIIRKSKDYTMTSDSPFIGIWKTNKKTVPTLK